ncbi:MAG: PVC-type heme-binding CxxCH protein [Verrucomicrobiota bacterium]
MKKLFVVFLLAGVGLSVSTGSEEEDFPIVAPDLEVSLFARDPLVRNPCAITFDAKGRLCVGMGPQYRKPKPDTPGDSVFILIDEDGDGTADARKEFATGFNAIQGMAWKGKDLWVANVPEMTIVRDLDGDDVADEYVRLWTDLGNLEHGLHGLNFAPDGRLYMSKGNSKGLTQAPDRVAPAPFRDLWGVKRPGLVTTPTVVSNRANYEKQYHHPSDDWGIEGGVLRCEDDGLDLEIVSRGFRNPWDMAFDHGFNWLGTDNDQNHGDKIFSPFFGAHFGWGHPWSYEWEGLNHLPSAPANGPLFEGSGTGVIFAGLSRYPEKYRGVFLINDWLNRELLVYRPKWKGAHLLPDRAELEVIAHADGGRSMGLSAGRRFDPVDIEIGPDGALYVSSWGREYGAKIENGAMKNEGRIYRIWPEDAPPQPPQRAGRSGSLAHWSIDELMVDLGSHLPVWRSNAQEELVRRGAEAVGPLKEALKNPKRSTALETWVLWTLARLPGKELEGFFTDLALGKSTRLNARLQAIRILGFRGLVPAVLKPCFEDSNARIRMETVLAIREAGRSKGWTEVLVNRLKTESDRHVYYALWGALGDLMPASDRQALLQSPEKAIRRGMLLSLLEQGALEREAVIALKEDPDPATARLAARWLGGKSEVVIKGPALDGSSPKGDSDSPQDEGRDDWQVSYIKNLKAKKGHDASYRLARLREGGQVYTDRSYRLTEIPDELEDSLMIRTPNKESDLAGLKLIFDCDYDLEVLVAHDQRIKAKPSWLKSFERMGGMVKTSDAVFDIYVRKMPAGQVELGANREDAGAGGSSHYFVVLQPQILVPKEKRTTQDEVLALLPRADARRGRDLFLGKSGAGCYVCHQLEGVGNVFGPDLKGIASRATDEFLVHSILEPSAIITEGFTQQVLTTRDGESYAGLILEETGTQVKLAQVNGEVVTVPRSLIEKRESLPLSSMPSTYPFMLTAMQVADVVAYMKTTGANQAEEKTSEPKAVSVQPLRNPAPDAPFRFERDGEALHLDLGDSRIATYLLEHPDLKRRAFVNVKTPSGIPVTRPFPAGEDADHRFMHPGISLAFGWLDGVDYWRMKAEVRHAGFLEEPETGPGFARFAVLNNYLSPDKKQVVCQEVAHYRFERVETGVLLKLDSTFSNSERDFFFGDQEEGGLCLRVAPELRVDQGSGEITNDNGDRNGKGTRGKSFKWLDYSGPSQGRRVGMRVTPHPENERVCWAHSRDYGLMVANPFPRQPRGQREPWVKTKVSKDEPYRLRFSVLIYDVPMGEKIK